MTLRGDISTPSGKHRYVRELFARIAGRYDFITRVLSFGRDQHWKRRLLELARIAPTDRVLDVACGTGDLAFGSRRYGARQVVGLDLALPMIQRARKRAAGRPAPFLVGDMMRLPFGAGAFDLVTTGYGLRNVPVLHEAIREIHRVLVPGGRLLSLDFNRPANGFVRGVYLTYLTIVGSALGLLLHGRPDTYRYIAESIRIYPQAEAVARVMEAEGFGEVRVVPVLFGLMTIHAARRH